MGNCQAIDAATLVIQHPCGKSDRLYWPVTAAEVMKTNPGHYVALLLSSALCPSATKGPASSASADAAAASAGDQVRVTRIKLLRPPDILTLGRVYRLITNQEVMKVLSAKKQAKMAREGREIRVKQQPETTTTKRDTSPEIRRKDSQAEGNDGMQRQRQRQTSSSSGAPKHSASGRSRSWQPTLMSITEAV
ncbi:hypothetical protein MLD38_027169 [Melastoma candidum]|uniref:Uncharacterized protein n=1 Tax=Melastoma candidum TaxID=119954 RepID=A0ACB9P0V9_9MYRT|nr:hypothetical protein MLD38_027169 [Melastoma candidum]